MENTKLRSTYLDNIKYGYFGRKNWRFVDVSDNTAHVVGPIYPTKEILLSDMRRYLTENWGLI